ncbi:MAG: NADH-quinone oxidoreductase subunit A [Phycisphaerae bacterium]
MTLLSPMITSMRMVGTSVPAADQFAAYQYSSTELVLGMVLFAIAGFAIVFVGLLLGKFVRPTMPHPEKGTAYECGEPAIGDSWVQFDLRFYTVALVFIVFDVEIALLWPWAVVLKDMGGMAFWPFLVFFLLIAIPFAYEWKSGYLTWVRDTSAQNRRSLLDLDTPATPAAAPVVADDSMAPEPAGTVA